MQCVMVALVNLKGFEQGGGPPCRCPAWGTRLPVGSALYSRQLGGREGENKNMQTWLLQK